MLKNISGLLCAILILEINAAYNRDETGDGNYRIQDRTPRENSEQGTTSIWDPENTKTAHHRSQEPTENVPELSHAEGIVQEVSAGEELNALLNCNAFTHVIYLLRKAETDLRSTVIRPTYSTENLPIDRARFQLGKARFWVQKLHLQMRRLYRSCLHLGAFKDFLKAHAHALQQENMLGLHSASYNERKMSNEEQRREDISGQRSQNRGNFGRVQSTQNSNRVLLSRGNVSIYNIQRNNLAYNVDRKNRGRLYASLGTELVKMVERNSVLDIAKILQKLVDLEERWRMKASQQTNSNEGFKTQIEIGGLLREVPPYFLSVALGPRILHNGLLEHISRSKKFLTLTRGLAPAMLRVGGSAANFLTFNDNAKQFARNGDNVSSLAKGDVISPDSALYLQRLQGTGSGDMVQSAGHSTNLTDSKETEIETLPRDQAMADEEVEDDCVFDFKWHSFYKTKPQNDSTYDVLKAILRASEVNSSSSNDSENAEMRDEPSKPDVETCDSYEGGKLENFTISGNHL
ncbi:hypothetical protein SK128_002594 [Halocaridina rubra]|uniref:Uncharacterized protein n=1 Tax=Halocaridina rubra TaxID=373956 RepID=A0AAN8XD18_HALRR